MNMVHTHAYLGTRSKVKERNDLMKGWVYVFSNKAMPGLVKIGYTDRDPEERIKEQHSGLPYSHELEYEILVNNPHSDEQSAHRKLASKHESKEWFRCTPEEAVNAIRSVTGSNYHIENYKKADREKAEKTRRREEVAQRAKATKKAERIRSEKNLEEKRRIIKEKYDKKIKQIPSPETATLAMKILVLLDGAGGFILSATYSNPPLGYVCLAKPDYNKLIRFCCWSGS